MMLDLVSADFSDFHDTLFVPYQVLYGYENGESCENCEFWVWIILNELSALNFGNIVGWGVVVFHGTWL